MKETMKTSRFRVDPYGIVVEVLKDLPADVAKSSNVTA